MRKVVKCNYTLHPLKKRDCFSKTHSNRCMA